FMEFDNFEDDDTNDSYTTNATNESG
ncbi:hypothetical protein ENU1_177800, partial [Entamoeba nuttalli P19]